ncbi:hypothetical protein CDCA_CDCA01G0390 [Cyanidium caldarium]|uniref:Uncharacterized protein n=1 Tax=Cyanidium caldarium TaxID=2771 RepID=A0AAV9IQ03_CYACA|nr:hypothetical protein CDCA_CDCA01G0390 [Cyanidium caldarium]
MGALRQRPVTESGLAGRQVSSPTPEHRLAFVSSISCWRAGTAHRGGCSGAAQAVGRPPLPSRRPRPVSLHWRGRVRWWSVRACASPSPEPSTDDDDDDDVAVRIHDAFLNACVPTRGVPYVNALKAFIAATAEAYRRGYSLEALDVEVRRASSETRTRDGRPVVQRPLQSDEVELRTIWLTLVYKALRYIDYPRERLPPDVDAAGMAAGRPPSPSNTAATPITTRTTAGATRTATEFRFPDPFDRFVKSIVDAARAGYDLARIKLEQQIRNATTNNSEADASAAGGSSPGAPRSSLESAILAQSTRLVWLTVQVVDGMSGDGGAAMG